MVDAQAAVRHWSDTTLVRLLHGGHRNEVWLCRSSGLVTVLRRSTRTSAQLAWELALLRHLERSGVLVPQVIAGSGGSAHLEGWHLLTYIEGQVLLNSNDERLRSSLLQVHACTPGWPQRPGFLTASDLLSQERGGDVDLTLMPPDLVAAIRDAWNDVASTGLGVVHADAGAGNAVLTPDGSCALIDWDESRVDSSVFDIGQGAKGERARLAWEIATCWAREPDYATGLVPAFLAE